MSQTASATGANSTPLSPSEAGANGEVEASHSGSGDNQSQKRDRSQGRAENEISGGEMEAHREDDKDDKNEHIEPEANENSENEKGWKRKKGTESFSSRRFRPSERFLSEKPVRPSKRPLRKANETLVEYNKRLWKVDIDRSTVVAWKKGDQWENIEWPQPVLQVFYHRKPDAAHSFQDDDKKSKYTAQQDDEDMYEPLGKSKNIHRITIHSEPLTDELNSILQVSSASTKLTVSPPYKYLLCAYPEIPARLRKIKEDIGESNEKIAKNSSQTPSSQIRNEVVEQGDMGPPKENKESGSPSTLILNSENRATSAFGPNTSSHFEPNDSVKVEIDQRDELETLYAHLKLLYDFITEELASIIEFRKKIADGTLKRICFEDLWHLFMPGERIFSLENGNKQLYTVYSITGGLPILRRTLNHERVYMDNLRDRVRDWRNIEQLDEEEQFEQLLRDESVGIGSWTPLKIDCHYIAFNGEYCGPVEELKRIAPYTGERAVTDLPVFPVQFHPEFSSLIQDMVSRGRKSLFSRGHKSYEGRTLAVKRSDRRIDVQSDVYIDFQAYYNDVPERKPKVGRLLRSRQNDALVEEDIYDDTFVLSGHEIDTMLADKYMTRNRRMLEEIKPTETDLADEYLCLLPCYSLGYIFQLRKWGYLNIDLVEDIDQESAEARAAGFDDLVIPTRYRNLLVALVDSHVSGLQRGIEKKKKAPTQVDIVRGKGQGLIVLLHGPPGAGKTSTAETIAAYTRRPLYSITCGDLGTEPDIVETNLLKHTERADRWGCVLLLDEADVFLARRDWNNMHRNALVSIFLRQLEYYAGILFLTTNRLGGIDEAFKSRVHISLRYPSIDLESTKQMWTNIMKRFEKDNATADVKIIFDKDSLLEFAQRHFEKCQAEGVTWNGRQIRNAFQTALALGHYDRLAKIKEAGLTPDEALASGKKKWRAVKLTKANFQSIAKTTREFEQYIASVRGDDALNAIDDELRRDDYDPDRPKARKSYPAAKVTAAASSKGKKSARKEQVPSEDEDGENFEDGEDSEDLDDDEDDDDDDSD